LKLIVIDASVAIKWFIPEIYAIPATSLLDKKFKLLAPDLIFAEVGDILWKKWRLNELAMDIANSMLDDFKKMPFDIHENEALLNVAWQMATTYNCTVYDSLYVALAEIERALLVTADRVLYNTLKTTPLAKVLLWVEDVKNIT
jgi:predicted nucleic acid-binding protein